MALWQISMVWISAKSGIGQGARGSLNAQEEKERKGGLWRNLKAHKVCVTLKDIHTHCWWSAKLAQPLEGNFGSKVYNAYTLQPTNATPRFIPFWNRCTWEPHHIHRNVYSSIICSSQNLEVSQKNAHQQGNEQIDGCLFLPCHTIRTNCDYTQPYG